RTMPYTAPSSVVSQLVDINGDGLDDWVYGDTSNTYVALNHGTSWAGADSQWTIATSSSYDDPGSTNYYERGIRFADVNGDGLPDFLRSYSVVLDSGCNDPTYGEPGGYHIVYLNTGNGWASTTPALGYALPNFYEARDHVGSPCTWDPLTHE